MKMCAVTNKRGAHQEMQRKAPGLPSLLLLARSLTHPLTLNLELIIRLTAAKNSIHSEANHVLELVAREEAMQLCHVITPCGVNSGSTMLTIPALRAVSLGNLRWGANSTRKVRQRLVGVWDEDRGLGASCTLPEIIAAQERCPAPGTRCVVQPRSSD
ncbi:hypothetical protein GE21DRAFT_2221 [Neurospora crassa]|uniref:Uncharacterized protein n=1 Tax=Neurospora crassa (strain ATCC 24698 / 74-OR23-1A / CBS 708.71 / DSM 1257 / FGSC 987) TaxID=367110 RepID=V5IR66_NEUCR|nr:hypothetical protein NCU00516 [Neurospora crassa OR74A]ESA44330.1 hypothetical protein NCU00516 [Neurospora crassa OR74A]KHE85092.1 hypothetical protein GE21DRAFT_2221 [Neurospora crassa]|eukprot:XP_011392777.1 hypothetical protein NCU00516 [Neurospora crassa OR74A]